MVSTPLEDSIDFKNHIDSYNGYNIVLSKLKIQFLDILEKCLKDIDEDENIKEIVKSHLKKIKVKYDGYSQLNIVYIDDEIEMNHEYILVSIDVNYHLNDYQSPAFTTFKIIPYNNLVEKIKSIVEDKEIDIDSNKSKMNDYIQKQKNEFLYKINFFGYREYYNNKEKVRKGYIDNLNTKISKINNEIKVLNLISLLLSYNNLKHQSKEISYIIDNILNTKVSLII